MGSRHRDFLSVTDLEAEEVETVFQWASEYKADTVKEGLKEPLLHRAVAILFEKPSLRTRVTFELAVKHLGGHPIVLTQAEVGIGTREAVKDIALNLERWVDMIVARVYRHETLEEMAHWAAIPVINALSDIEHPCQALADLFTLKERYGELTGRHLVFIGDGYNVAHSLMLLCAMLGVNVSVITPKGYEPKEEIFKRAVSIASATGASVNVGNEPKDALKNADAIYTDVWVSMGQEQEAQRRKADFAPYQVNERLLELAPKHAIVMHCLPAHRGEEITDDVLDSDRCVALEQAENRLHTQKALLALIAHSV
ncbi:MAG: ornithine carbamoyltransferase [Armatimonadota bacterium]|nr:ornithine carbamoyltransferase [Armatimonadota bacterium]MCX7778312.1 ornithine carbamoyltransferase [Armatimonadota bacterium]MDW8025664.1 ornithine carbamoyltransferase [Armatimonadota bacterium]